MVGLQTFFSLFDVKKNPIAKRQVQKYAVTKVLYIHKEHISMH